MTPVQCVFTYRSYHFSWSRQIGVKLGPADETELLRLCCFTIAVLCHSTAARHRSHYLIPPTQCTAKIKSRLKVLIIPDTWNSADSPVSEVTVGSSDGARDTKLLALYEVDLPHKFPFKGENKVCVVLCLSQRHLVFAQSLHNRMFLQRNVPHVRQTHLAYSKSFINTAAS